MSITSHCFDKAKRLQCRLRPRSVRSGQPTSDCAAATAYINAGIIADLRSVAHGVHCRSGLICCARVADDVLWLLGGQANVSVKQMTTVDDVLIRSRQLYTTTTARRTLHAMNSQSRLSSVRMTRAEQSTFLRDAMTLITNLKRQNCTALCTNPLTPTVALWAQL